MTHKNLRICYLICLIDFVAASIVFPILPVLFLKTDGLLPVDSSLHVRTLLFGITLAVFPLGEFICSSFAPKLSDSLGRKKIIIPLLFIACFGVTLSSIAIYTKNIWLLIFSRWIGGIGASTTAISKAIISDVSADEDRIKNFANLSIIFPLSLIIGPLLGSAFSDKRIVSWFDFTTPFYILSIFYVISIILSFTLKETITKNLKEISINPIKTFIKYVKNEKIALLFAWIILFTLGWNIFFKMLPTFIITKFSVDHQFLGIMYAYIGFWMVLSNLLFVRRLYKRFEANKALSWLIPILAMLLCVLLIFDNYLTIIFLFILPLIGLLENTIKTGMSSMVSHAVPKNEQGEMQGVYYSVITTAKVIGPLLGGYLISYHLPLPFTLGAFFLLLSWVFLKKLQKKSELTVSKE